MAPWKYIYIKESKRITPGQRLLQDPVGQCQHAKVQNSHIKRNLEHQGRGVAMKKIRTWKRLNSKLAKNSVSKVDLGLSSVFLIRLWA